MTLEELRCYMNWRASPIPMPGRGEAAVGVGDGSGKRRDCRGATGREDSARGALGGGRPCCVPCTDPQESSSHPDAYWPGLWNKGIY